MAPRREKLLSLLLLQPREMLLVGHPFSHLALFLLFEERLLISLPLRELLTFLRGSALFLGRVRLPGLGKVSAFLLFSEGFLVGYPFGELRFEMSDLLIHPRRL